MLLTTFGFLAIAFAVFTLFGVAVNCIHPLLGIFFAYYIFVPYRAITESKIRFIFQKKHEVLQQVDELKSNFLSFISHDLKTPVARIQGLADMLVAQPNLDPETRRLHLVEISRSTEDLNHFITSILNLAKIVANRIKLNRTSRDVNKIVEDVIEKIGFNARQKQIRIEANLEPLFPIKVDIALMGQVLTNLIENAVKYSPEDRVVKVSTREDGSWIVVEVKDHGFGMDEADVQNVFTKFYRGKNPATINIKGSGLGLYLVKYFVELHNGQISVESELGKGSIFTVRLPLVED
jgi:signal transduction histidine kinase